MSITRSIARLAAGSLLAGSLALAGTAGTAFAGTPQNPAVTGSPAAANCVVRDGSSPAGQRTGDNPVRFEYSDSPYVGARYDGCEGKVKIYYGGYMNITHYNMRVNGVQSEASPGERMVRTIPVNPGGSLTVEVQACERGQSTIFGRKPSSCTRFSPPVTVQMR